MATKLITVLKAQAEIERLQKYISLVEKYQTDTWKNGLLKSMLIRTALHK